MERKAINIESQQNGFMRQSFIYKWTEKMKNNHIKAMTIFIIVIGLSSCSNIKREKIFEPFIELRQMNVLVANEKLNDEIIKINNVDDISSDQPDEADRRIFSLLLRLIGQKVNDNDQGQINNDLKEFFNIDPDDKFRKIRPSLIKFLGSANENTFRKRDTDADLNFDQGKLRPFVEGIGGFNTYLALNGLISCHRDGRNQAVKFGEQRFYGKIDSYTYNKNTSEGYIGFTTRHVIDCKDGLQPILNEYIMHIVIQSDEEKYAKGFEVLEISFEDGKIQIKGDSGDVDKEMLFPIPVQEYIKRRGLDYKLHANFPSINVLAAFKDGELLDEDSAIYERNEDSCIDILFSGPPPTLSLPKQADYCMGRCSDPPIINSGT